MKNFPPRFFTLIKAHPLRRYRDPMHLAYADPPYLHSAHRYARHHPNPLPFNSLPTHRHLITLLTEYDAWALSLSSPSLPEILSLIPPPHSTRIRIAAWVKPFAPFRPNVPIAYTWEPVIFSPKPKPPTRTPTDRTTPTIRDHLAESPTRKTTLPGAKPPRFNIWILSLLQYSPQHDTFTDLFPGTNSMHQQLTHAAALTHPPPLPPNPSQYTGQGQGQGGDNPLPLPLPPPFRPPVQCPMCQEWFTPTRSTRKTCSPRCRQRLHRYGTLAT
jgi:hypothetical protein